MTVGKDDVRFISGPPRVFDGKVIIGHGGADVGSIRGYVTAYDAETGKQLWRFWTVPGQPGVDDDERSEEHTSGLQSLMRISYAVFCLKKQKNSTSSHTN